jgi:proteasome lid subunit RPN8/RPN11
MAMSLTQGTLEKIKVHSVKERPKEACGILVGPPGGKTDVTDVISCTNVDENPYSAYTIHPEELLKAIDKIESDKGLKLLGFYHSHPFSSPHPSMVDQKRATWDRFIYAIYSVEKDKIHCWRWHEAEGEFVEEKVKIL